MLKQNKRNGEITYKFVFLMRKQIEEGIKPLIGEMKGDLHNRGLAHYIRTRSYQAWPNKRVGRTYDI